MSGRHIHIIGAGMAGLSAALQLALSGEKVVIYEAAPFAGGRCRSHYDRDLDCRIDNGNHLVLSGNTAVHDYLYLTNALGTVGGPGKAIFPFFDLVTGERWTVKPNSGVIPWWLFDKKKRIPGTNLRDYLSLAKILRVADNDTLKGFVKQKSPFYSRFLEPLIIGALNTEPEIASASLFRSVLAQTFGGGARACIPLIPKIGLSETFVTPCLTVLHQHGVEINFYHRLRSMMWEGDCVRQLAFNSETIEIDPQDWVILALPAWFMREVLPEVPAPNDFRSIFNAHFRVDCPPLEHGFVGLIGGYSEWLFLRNGVASVTVSCAERFRDFTQREMGALIWEEVAAVLNLDVKRVPPYRLFLEKYATIAATPQQDARRPSSYTGWKNVALAAEWTATGLPSTIEGALRSGMKAAQVVMRWK
ncbi:MAG: hydroxysqualene dehydroxylase HpnE [Alphaproteobacteria bacterium]|nr:hydroxysqualene dehydroxylase HpnE [Alphaproteobacteria bacterium]